MLCMVYTVCSYFLLIMISTLRLKFIFMPRKTEFGIFNTMSFVVVVFFFLISVHLFQLLHNLTDKCALPLSLVNLLSPYLPRELPVPRFYIYPLYSCMRYGELYWDGVKKQWDLSAKDTQGICDRRVKALPKPHALPMRMSAFPFVRGFSSLSKSSGEDQVDITEYSPINSRVQAQLCLVQKLEKIRLCLTGVPCSGGTIGSSVS